MNNNEIIKAHEGVRVGGVDRNMLKDTLRTILKDACILGGSEPVDDHVNRDADILQQKVETSYRHLTLEEIRLAIEYGQTRQYGNNSASLQLANVFNWLDLFNKSQERREILQTNEFDQKRNGTYRYPQPKEERWPHYTDDELVKRCWENYKRNGWDFWCKPYTAMICRLLEERGKLRNISEESREACKALARREMTRAQGLGAIMNRDLTSDAAFDEYYRTEVLHRYFDTLRKKGIELQTI